MTSNECSSEREDEPTRILLAEDDGDLRELLALALRREGYVVVEVDDGNQLARHIQGMQHGSDTDALVDLVITDVHLPGPSGLEALERLRGLNWSLPVILITAFPDTELREAVRRAGAAVLLDKPFEVDDLCAAANYFASPQ